MIDFYNIKHTFLIFLKILFFGECWGIGRGKDHISRSIRSKGHWYSVSIEHSHKEGDEK